MALALLIVSFAGLWALMAIRGFRELNIGARGGGVQRVNGVPSDTAVLRPAFLSAAVVFGVLVFAITEVTSAFGSVNAFTLGIAWLAVVLVVVALLVRSARGLARPVAQELQNRTKALLSNRIDLWLLGVVFFILTVTLTTALVARPAIHDAFTYHLPRVLHWIQNQSVAIYPSNIERQNQFQPWTGFAVMHLMLLAGSEKFVHLSQWFAFLGSIVAASLVARKLGAARRGQILSAILVATLPLAILQSSTTQSDLTSGFWAIASVYYFLRAATHPARRDMVLGGAAFGLAAASKATAAIISIPMLSVLALRILVKDVRRGAGTLAIAGAIALSLNVIHNARMLEVYGTLAPPDPAGGGSVILNDRHGVVLGVLGVIRHIAPHLSTPIDDVNARTTGLLRLLHEWLGVDPDDRGITFPNSRFIVETEHANVNNGGNAIHLILVFWMFASVLLFRDMRDKSTVFMYAAACLIGFAVFASVFIWHPWLSRYHLPFFVMTVPLVAVALERTHRTPFGKAGWIGLLGLVLSLPYWLFFGYYQSWFGENSIFVGGRP